ncbi:hypothetical protein BH11ACT6_BH11ACT6_47390 [soil metagenome]
MHPLAWMDVISNDIERSLGCYANLFGWTSERVLLEAGGEYRVVRAGDVIVAGAEQVAAERDLEATWTLMIEADDARPLIDSAVAAGAVESSVLAPLADLGSLAMLRDPWGATLGVWQPGPFRPSATPLRSGSLVGGVLQTPNPRAAVDFYSRILGWRTTRRGLDAGLPVRVVRQRGAAHFTPVMHRSLGSAESVEASVQACTELTDPMGAHFFVTTKARW